MIEASSYTEDSVYQHPHEEDDRDLPSTSTPSARFVIKIDPKKASISPMPVRKEIVEEEEEYQEEEYKEDEGAEEEDAIGEDDYAAIAEASARPNTRRLTRSSTSQAKTSVIQKEEEEDEDEDEFPVGRPAVRKTRTSRGREIAAPVTYEESGSDEVHGLGRVTRNGGKRKRGGLNGFIAVDEEEQDPNAQWGVRTRSKSKPPPPPPAKKPKRSAAQQPLTVPSAPRPRTTRNSNRNGSSEDFTPGSSGSNSAGHDMDADGSADFEPEVDQEVEREAEELNDDEEEQEEDDGGRRARGYEFRKRKTINYAIPTLPSLEEEEKAKDKRKGKSVNFGAVASRKKGLNWSTNGRDLSNALGMPVDDSDDDNGITNTPRKPSAFPGLSNAGGSMFAPTGGIPGDITAGTPSNLGKVSGDGALADADPLGVNINVTFDAVGGLDDHIKQLKEMVSLPLLYPELFQRFNVTPPRGVLFHGPPGTGKTLLARALAASCSTGTTKISFFMRKGADCLSKWVGEAERQLRLLFEEARACQPSIIFFDEIDGLAPVRSSKQDQIHASIVSTLLALMDGMDGRGQVIVIGATNRPDAVDPALRRPGRFDREFYFPLPDIVARKKIIDIHTKGWEPELDDTFKDNLATVTKGYGGADLRALCTEAALNAIQRRYPQIYKTSDRLLLKAESISVQARDFMVSVKSVVPSSARSASSAAAPLPQQLEPLLAEALEKAKAALDRALPPVKKRSVLEDAEWEDEDPSGGGFEKELLMQSLETLRVYRPRVLIHGPTGMGQNFIGAAALHHLEGFNVQSLDLGTLMSDSTRTPEAAVVQLFVEAKRHKPSVVFIPSLLGWANAVTETTRSTVKSMLDSLSPSDPVLLLAIVDGPIATLPKDVKAWFGFAADNRIHLTKPTHEQRSAFFTELLDNASRPPNEFPDGVPRKRRVLEELPIAPPLPPREPTEQELAQQRDNDAKLKEYLKWRLGPVLSDLKRKYKKFAKSALDEYDLPQNYFDEPQPAAEGAAVETEVNGTSNADAIVVDGEEPVVNGITEPAPSPPPPPPRFHNIDLERIGIKLYYDAYLTPQAFLNDIALIVANAEYEGRDMDRLWKAKQMQNYAGILVDGCCDAQFRLECERAAQREKKRQDAQAKAAKPKPNGKQQTYAPGTRTSARVNGIAPEYAVTDLSKIEKQAKERKRARAGSQENETTGSSDDTGRAAKRIKLAHPEDADVSMEPVPAADEMAVDPAPALDAGAAAPAEEMAPVVPAAAEDPFVVPPTEAQVIPSADLLPTMPEESPALLATHGTLYTNPIAGPSTVPFIPQEFTAAPQSPSPVPLTSVPEQLVPDPPVEIEPEMPAASPRPPPVFHLDAALLWRLKQQLTDRTGTLNIEQLEQLRAMCLDRVWRRRAEWDRDELALEMLALLDSFLAEVAEEDEEM